MTVKELIERLKEYDEDREVQLVIANVDAFDIRDCIDPESLTATIYADERGYIEFNLSEDNILEIEGTWR